MSPAHVLDRYYLSITLLVTIAYQLLGFAIAWTFQFDKITDFTGGSNFFIIALLTLLMGNTFYARNIVASVLVMIWATRLAGFLLFRVLKTGSDTRFDEFRSHFFKFLAFWIGQILWVWTVSLPLTILNSPAVSDPSLGGSNSSFGTGCDIAGVILWGIGWFIETTADAQKFRYKASNPPKDRPMNTGVWRWSRHPPYFGEILCWWGIWILCLSPTANGDLSSGARKAQYASVLSPIFTTLLLMFASGIPTAEKPTGRKYYLMSHSSSSPFTSPPSSASALPANPPYPDAWKKYQSYLHSTSILIPIHPKLYRPLPRWIKRTVLLDFPIYGFDEHDGQKALEEEGKKKANGGDRSD
ncbi:unnamed protein product [Somion occarium]|uniref:Steroid 5-alpha reductase C-terminal domain-containing protein n=1 Tax=Somion occarium TaxID=3059160 RepID=A0ABP1E8Z3_9APHY